MKMYVGGKTTSNVKMGKVSMVSIIFLVATFPNHICSQNKTSDYYDLCKPFPCGNITFSFPFSPTSEFGLGHSTAASLATKLPATLALPSSSLVDFTRWNSSPSQQISIPSPWLITSSSQIWAPAHVSPYETFPFHLWCCSSHASFVGRQPHALSLPLGTFSLPAAAVSLYTIK